MSEETTVYRAYLLRLWCVGQDTWRASLHDTCSQEPHVFANLEQLFTFLWQETGGPPGWELQGAMERGADSETNG